MFTPQNYQKFDQNKEYPSHPDTHHTGIYSNFHNQNLIYNSQEINKYHQELNNYERQKKRGNTDDASKCTKFFHFVYSDEINFSPEKKVNLEKKINFSSDFSKTLVKMKKESNLHYVGFENNYGDNSCYINVILHFFYQFPSVNEFLIKTYIDCKENYIINDENDKNWEKQFFFLLGKTLFEYQSILSQPNNKGITILHTTELRKYLHLISNKKYTYNAVGDPVELLTFILDKINLINKSEVHKDFFINLNEEIKCNNCNNVKTNKYDENNFIHQIYVNEIIKGVKNLDFYHTLFYYSKKNPIIDGKTCEKCNQRTKRSLKYIGSEYPKYLLMNCVWSKKRPELLEVLKFLYLIPLESHLNNIFDCENSDDNNPPIYTLSGIIFYSGALSHYINVIYNMQKNIFVLYNDDKIKELKSIHDIYLEITAEQIKKNSEAFYYPVLLIYFKEILFNCENDIKLNIYTPENFHYIEKECIRAKNKNKTLTEEQKRRNYVELERAQIRKMSVDPKYASNLMAIEDDFKYGSENRINMNYNFNINTNYNIHYSNNNIFEESKNRKNSFNDDMKVEDAPKDEKIFGFENDSNEIDNYEGNKYSDFKRGSKKSMTDFKNYNQQNRSRDFFSDII